ncbi:MAG: hypothetical protein IPO81_10375 [Kouleothrix sp.]|nr:hypothetical protein [Kouleothrix sp.]
MTQEPSAGERQTTERLKPPTGPLTPVLDRRARRPGPWRWVALAAAALLAVLALFLLTRPADPLSDPRPVEVVRGFAAALEAKDADKLLAAIEPTVFRREISPEIRSYVEYLQEVRFDNARYELLDSDGERAHVRWTATMHYTLDLGDETKAGQQPIDTTFELSKIEGTWYLHSAKLPET